MIDAQRDVHLMKDLPSSPGSRDVPLALAAQHGRLRGDDGWRNRGRLYQVLGADVHRRLSLERGRTAGQGHKPYRESFRYNWVLLNWRDDLSPVTRFIAL